MPTGRKGLFFPQFIRIALWRANFEDHHHPERLTALSSKIIHGIDLEDFPSLTIVGDFPREIIRFMNKAIITAIIDFKTHAGRNN